MEGPRWVWPAQAHLALARSAGPFGPGPIGRPIWPRPVWRALANLTLASLANLLVSIFQKCFQKRIFGALGVHFSRCHFLEMFPKAHF